MNKKLLDKIIDNFDTVFRGDAWHGPSVMEIINSLPFEKAKEINQFSKQTISQHIYHLTAWRKFALEKLNDNIHYSLETDDDNWGSGKLNSEKDYQNLISNLKTSHKNLIDKLEEFDDSFLDKNVPGEYYDFYKLLNGLIQHDTYHLGMIWTIWE